MTIGVHTHRGHSFRISRQHTRLAPVLEAHWYGQWYTAKGTLEQYASAIDLPVCTDEHEQAYAKLLQLACLTIDNLIATGTLLNRDEAE